MIPLGNGVTDAMGGLAAAMRVRDARVANPRARTVGGPLPDPRWDAFFGSLNDQSDLAHSAGFNFHVNTPSLGGLRTVFRK